MMSLQSAISIPRLRIALGALLLVGSLYLLLNRVGVKGSGDAVPQVDPSSPPRIAYQPRRPLDTSGFTLIGMRCNWSRDASLDEIASIWRSKGGRCLKELDQALDQERALGMPVKGKQINFLLQKAMVLNYLGEPQKAYEVLGEARSTAQSDSRLRTDLLYTIIYFQGLTALRLGETENCVLCRGESSCIVPISPAAFHTNPAGSQGAVHHFTEYLSQFPGDLEVRWLLNIAHMTLGQYPEKVDPHHVISLDRIDGKKYGIGKFRDVGHLLGINRLNEGGGAIMDDFDNDGLLDLVFSSWDPCQPMVFYRNKGDGTFEDRTEAAGLSNQLGGLNCVQTDYNNDGHLDIFIMRGGWFQSPIVPSLLRNNGDGTFTDVTVEAGLDEPVNSMAAVWFDYDNDGFLDLFVCCEMQPNKLYHNLGNGKFEDVAAHAGVAGKPGDCCKGAAWIDFDNDGYPDLFLNNLGGTAKLFRNNRDGTFTDVTAAMGIDGPKQGFSCWAWDYDNDGWPDIFATSYDKSMDDFVRGVIGQPHQRNSNRLFKNMGGKGFQDVTKEAGLDMVFSTMGSNFGDFDNDGYLDFYLGTGDPGLASLQPNRMFRNIGGTRFEEITGSSGTGHLQKGHGVACGDWDRDGNIDIAIELGGAVPGDRYHNAMFQNPGQGNHSLTVKLTGKMTNRAAIGARIKVVTAGDQPQTIYRYITSGSSFGANPLEQTIGVGKAEKVALLEVHWPSSGTTQTFRNVDVNQYIEITEFANEFKKKVIKQVPLPK